MIKSASQLKGKIKNLAKGNVRKAETYIRLYFMERLLERISISKYKDRFVIKGGILASSLLGIDMRTTMDIDTTVRSLPLTDDDIQKFINEICSIEIGDSVAFRITHTEQIIRKLCLLKRCRQFWREESQIQGLEISMTFI